MYEITREQESEKETGGKKKDKEKRSEEYIHVCKD